MRETVVIFISFDFVEIVHIQLSHKRREIPVLEVLRQYLICEFGHLFDHKSSSSFVPCDDARKSWFLLGKKWREYLQNLVDLIEEGGCSSLCV